MSLSAPLSPATCAFVCDVAEVLGIDALRFTEIVNRLPFHGGAGFGFGLPPRPVGLRRRLLHVFVERIESHVPTMLLEVDVAIPEVDAESRMTYCVRPHQSNH